MTDHPDTLQTDAFANAVERLRTVHEQLLAEPSRSISDVGEQATVMAAYQPVFSAEHLPELSPEEFTSFLRFENNKHWTGINRHGSRLTEDMDKLREALAILLDESQPLAERYDTATGMISGLSKATATPILLVAYPETYGVWNSISEIGLRELDLWPELPRGSSDGEQYAAVNDILNRLTNELSIDLWTLDALWDVMFREEDSVQHWRITLPYDRMVRHSESGRETSVWSICLENGIAAIDYDNNRENRQVKRFASIRRGDKIVAFLRNKRIGGIGIVTQTMDEQLVTEQPPELDLFGGKFWFRISVDWIEQELNVDALPKYAATMFGRGTVVSLTPGRYQAVVDAMTGGKLSRAFPIIARIIRKRYGELGEWVPHKDLRQALLDDPEGGMVIEETQSDQPGRAPETIASNLLAWFSQRYTSDPNFPYRDQFERSERQPYAYRPKAIVDKRTIADQFRGFTTDSFHFLAELGKDNTKTWMDANNERYKDSVREPMRHLFADVGPKLKSIADSYLEPEELEIKPDANHTLAKINKNWNATEDSKYYTWYWGAFYRAHRTKVTDAQLIVGIDADESRFGFYIGDIADDIRKQFMDRVLAEPQAFLSLLSELELESDFSFVRKENDGSHTEVLVRSEGDIRNWLGDHNFGIVRILSAKEVVALGPAFADKVLAAFQRVFPFLLWAVASDPHSRIDEYLTQIIEPLPPEKPYSEEDFHDRTYLEFKTIAELRDMIEDRKQVIFSGPPGTGKTYVARELGRLLTGLAEPPPERMTIIQFHPSYSYEDFIEGIRPKTDKNAAGNAIVEYPTVQGVFQKFCREARRFDGPCVFIIDEINRGNIPRIFGELMLLLEYRDEEVVLPYSGKAFSIPDNVYLIGTMNTADRSIALVDFALRRRFHFQEFAADPALFRRWLGNNETDVPYLAELYEALAKEAIEDRNYQIGASHFMKPGLNEESLERIWRWSIVPYLEEYYFGKQAQVDDWKWEGRNVLQIRRGDDGE